MPLEPGRYLHLPLAELVRDLASADPHDVPLPSSGSVQLHGPGLRADECTESLAYRGDNFATVANDTRLPDEHPDVEIPGVVLEQFLGGGAQGWVYAGRVQATNKIVAVKVLARGRDNALAWGAREALLCARVRHRNVLRVLRAQPVGAFWVVLMELVQGEELRRGTVSGAEARACFGALADALLALARSRLVHRDIKPANILLRRPDNSPVLIDFGLAVDLAEQEYIRTELSGTPFYMAPEAWRDAPPDPAWDAYALGVTAAVVLVGPPDMGRDLPTLRRTKLSGDFERLLGRSLEQMNDADMRRWVTRLIATEPAERQKALKEACTWSVA
jgi:serine/threonine protein kinase